jgi:hypothetical protein
VSHNYWIENIFCRKLADYSVKVKKPEAEGTVAFEVQMG